MAEGGLEFAEYDPLLPVEAAEEETSFTQSIPADPTADEPPMWANETEPQENEATPSELDRRLTQFEAERVNFPRQNLERPRMERCG